MKACEQLKEEYLKKLEELLHQYQAKSEKLRDEDAKDEAILEVIKGNVVDIFYKMFTVSYKKTCMNDASAEKLPELREAYLEFFKKIPAPWAEKMAKDEAHGMMEEYYKEQLKLETMEMVKDLFETLYSKYKVVA